MNSAEQDTKLQKVQSTDDNEKVSGVSTNPKKMKNNNNHKNNTTPSTTTTTTTMVKERKLKNPNFLGKKEQRRTNFFLWRVQLRSKKLM